MSQMKVAAKAFSSLPKESYIAGLTLLAIAGHLILRYAAASPPRIALLPLFGALIIGGIPLVSELAKKLFKTSGISPMITAPTRGRTALRGANLWRNFACLGATEKAVQDVYGIGPSGRR